MEAKLAQLYEQARSGDLDGWRANDDEAVALCMLLGQVPWYLFDDSRIFESLHAAAQLATLLFDTGRAGRLPLRYQMGLCHLLVHDEHLDSITR